jgi:hypothetical protein
MFHGDYQHNQFRHSHLTISISWGGAKKLQLMRWMKLLDGEYFWLLGGESEERLVLMVWLRCIEFIYRHQLPVFYIIFLSIQYESTNIQSPSDHTIK